MERLELSKTATDFLPTKRDVQVFRKRRDRFFEFLMEAVAAGAEMGWIAHRGRMN